MKAAKNSDLKLTNLAAILPMKNLGSNNASYNTPLNNISFCKQTSKDEQDDKKNHDQKKVFDAI